MNQPQSTGFSPGADGQPDYPLLIQGGMGVGVSNWRLARAVGSLGQLGVVSGTFLDGVFARRLQDGDLDGQMKFACDNFPYPEIAERVWRRYYLCEGKPEGVPYKSTLMFGVKPSRELLELTVLANFVEVFLAKHGHNGPIGINYLEKIQTPTLPSLYGAMLAGVDYVLMGAGIPKAIPGVLDKLSTYQTASIPLYVEDDFEGTGCQLTFDPAAFAPPGQPLKRPRFLAIVSSHTLAMNLAKKSSGKVDGFVVENHTAGGHNAPPRGPMTLDARGEPIYGDKDMADLVALAKLGLPFWLAGSFSTPEQLKRALAQGATGVQVGTAFAYCDESGITRAIKDTVIGKVLDGTIEVFTDPNASSSGYPFKIVNVPESLADDEVYAARPRLCDLGYLRTAYRRTDGSIGFRCPGEPVEDYVKKGGAIEDTEKRKCLCNGLMATIGLGQIHSDGYVEPPLVTAGNVVSQIKMFLPAGQITYCAADVVNSIIENRSSLTAAS
jgi:nitronate monooxygenase